MARTVKEHEYSARRSEILDAAQRLVSTIGYEQMSIQHVLDALHAQADAQAQAPPGAGLAAAPLKRHV